LPIGGTWVGAGDATDFAIGSGLLIRTATSDSSGLENGRLLTASTPSLTSMICSLSFPLFAAFGASAGALSQGLVARYVDSTHFVAAVIVSASPTPAIYVIRQNGAGSPTTLYFGAAPLYPADLAFAIDANGNYVVYSNGAAIASGYHSSLATGGALASGKVGIVDAYTSATAYTRSYDNFYAAGATSDAAVFASKKLQVRDNTTIRQDSAGTAYARPGDVRGDYLRIPASNVGGTVRMIVKASRGIPETGADTSVDDIAATLSVTPLYLTVP
jgi:hypothetical protein